jgi:hypothetical protein
MIRMILIIYILGQMIPIKAICQDKKFNNVRRLLLEGDSVFLVSHQVTGVALKEKKEYQILRLINKNKIDQSLILEKIAINKGSDRDTICKILTMPNSEYKTEIAKCMFAEHAIIILNKKKYSYIELSFSCHRVFTSDDISLTDFDFNIQKWSKLRDLFAKVGIKHGIN